MLLNNIDFGNILGGSGVEGFKGDKSEYWLHRIPIIKPNFNGMFFVAKTITLHERTVKDGANMELNPDWSPKEWFPACISINPITKAVINAVGLANPGAWTVLCSGLWQKRTEPFVISFMSIEDTEEERLDELREFVKLLLFFKFQFNASFALQINFSCPNAGLHLNKLLNEVKKSLEIASILNVPLIPKFSVGQISVEAGLEVTKMPHCDAICISNTIPWEKLPLRIKLTSFWIPFSPLWVRGILSLIWWRGRRPKGGYSGPYLFLQVLEWLLEFRKHDNSFPINAGGGIVSKKQILKLCKAGASSVFISSVALVRPWKVQGLIHYANNLTWR